MSNLQTLFETVGEVFKVDPSTLDESSSQDSIERWDSFGMINLINELEMIFEVNFNVLEIVEFRTIVIIKDALEAKGVDFS